MTAVLDGRYEICVGGTFSPIHLGHIKLLSLAFAHGSRVFVGLTSDEMASKGRTRQVIQFGRRRAALEEVLSALSKEHNTPYEIAPIDDRFGFATEGCIEAIAASEDTEGIVDEIDLVRKEKGLPPLKRFILPIVKDEAGAKISSTRVEGGEIGPDGRVLGRGKERPAGGASA